MNPQSGYYQGNARQAYSGGSLGCTRQVQYRTSPTYGGCPTPRAPATFPSCGTRNAGYPQQSSGARYAGYPQQSSGARYAGYPQQSARGCRASQSVQNIGRSFSNIQYRKPTPTTNNFQQAQKATYKPVQLPSARPRPRSAQPNGATQNSCTPQAIKVNISADQLVNAQKTPIFQDRSGACADQGDGSMKYIQLNWQDLLGGMDNLRVTMAPSSDNNNPNRQLRVSFGGQTGQINAGETPLKVVSIEPVQTPDGTYSGQCNPSNKSCHVGPVPAQNPYAAGARHRQTVSSKGYGRR